MIKGSYLPYVQEFLDTQEYAQFIFTKHHDGTYTIDLVSTDIMIQTDSRHTLQGAINKLALNIHKEKQDNE